jgi:hypothetical protein
VREEENVAHSDAQHVHMGLYVGEGQVLSGREKMCP